MQNIIEFEDYRFAGVEALTDWVDGLLISAGKSKNHGKSTYGITRDGKERISFDAYTCYKILGVALWQKYCHYNEISSAGHFSKEF